MVAEFIASFFPNGMSQYIIGGILLGIAVILIYIPTSYIVGASGVLDAVLSFVSRRFDPKHRGQQLLFAGGIVLGALLYAVFVAKSVWTTDVQWWRLLIGGVLVGYGVRIGRGCTSGHGICGTASLSKSSIINVVLFMVFAFIVAQVVMRLGVSP